MITLRSPDHHLCFVPIPKPFPGSSSQIWSRVPEDVDSLLYWLIISVGAEYQRRGIAHALMSHRLEDAVAMGCQGAVTEASALNSQKVQ